MRTLFIVQLWLYLVVTIYILSLTLISYSDYLSVSLNAIGVLLSMAAIAVWRKNHKLSWWLNLSTSLFFLLIALVVSIFITKSWPLSIPETIVYPLGTLIALLVRKSVFETMMAVAPVMVSPAQQPQIPQSQPPVPPQQ